jgi:hypothetical protein
MKRIARHTGAVVILAGMAGVVGVQLASESTSGAQAAINWTVWEQFDPCPTTRQDWMSVAKEDLAPSLGHFPASGAHATSDFANAQAQEAELEQGQRFADVCCRDYSIWKKSETSRWTMLKGMGTPGEGWMMEKPNLCCEEAAALIGQPTRCGEASAQPHVPYPPTTPPTSGPHDASGTWYGSNGLVYEFVQQPDGGYSWYLPEQHETGQAVVSQQGEYEISASWSGDSGSGAAMGNFAQVDAANRVARIEWDNGITLCRTSPCQ